MRFFYINEVQTQKVVTVFMVLTMKTEP